MTALLRTCLVLAPLFTLIVGLWTFAPRPSDPGYQAAIGTLRRVALRQARLERDVLRAHDGLLLNYDPLNDEIAEMRESANRLRADAGTLGWDQSALKTLCAQIDREEAAVERFKTDNALVINSLAYVDLASASLRSNDADLRIAFLVGQLADAVLRLLRAPTALNAGAIRAGLSEIDASLAQNEMPADLGIAAATLRRHALLLADVIPAVASDLQQVFGQSTAHDLRMMREAAERQHSVEERTATRFEMAILLTIAVLLAVSVRLGVLLHVAIQRQRHHSALERAIAQVSTGLVAQPSGDGGKAEALGELGEAFGADRALLTLGEEPRAQWHWSKTGAMPGEDWSDTIRALNGAGYLWMHDLIQIPDTAKLPACEVRAALLSAGVVSCYGVVLHGESGERGLFLLQRTQFSARWVPDGGLLRMAADVLGNAVRRQVEERKRFELEERLVRVRRLEAVGTFASGIAHNFSNVIGAVLGHAEMAEDALPDDATAAHHVHEIRRAGERAQDLVGRILEFGTRRRPSRELLAIDDFVAETASLLRGSLTAGSLITVPGAPGCFVAADTVQLQQVVINLVRNAAQASEPDAAVTMRTSFEHVSAPRRLSHGSLTPGDWVCLAVEDSGSGMDGTVLRQIFNPFFTTRPAGTGLGLATAREIVRDHAGILDVTSQPGNGTTIAVWLPLAQSQTEQEPVARSGNGQTALLLAVDEATVQRDEEMLAALGYEPVGFTKPSAMLTVLGASPSRFDAMLLSADMIKDANWAILTAVSHLAPNCPVIVTLCAAADVTSLPRGDITIVLHRPLQSSSVAAALTSCLQKPSAEGLSKTPARNSTLLNARGRG